MKLRNVAMLALMVIFFVAAWIDASERHVHSAAVDFALVAIFGVLNEAGGRE